MESNIPKPLPVSLPQRFVFEKTYQIPSTRERERPHSDGEDSVSHKKLKSDEILEKQPRSSLEKMKISSLLCGNNGDEFLSPFANIFGFPNDCESSSATTTQKAETEIASLLSENLPLVTFPTTNQLTIETTTSTQPQDNSDNNSNKELLLENLEVPSIDLNNKDCETLKIRETTSKQESSSLRTHSLNLKLPNLKKLEVDSCRHLHAVGDKYFDAPNLNYIKLSSLPKISNLSITNLIQQCNSLETLVLNNLHNLNEVTIPSSSTNLKRLEIVECRNIVGVRIANKSLKHLVVIDGRNLGQVTLSEPDNLKQLEILRLAAVPHFNFSSLLKDSECNLTCLELVSNAPNAKAYMVVENPSFGTFLKQQTKLEEIVLEKVKDITKEPLVEALLRNKSSLQRLVLDLCCVEKVKFKEMLKSCTNLKEFNVEKWYIKKKWKEW